MGAAGYSDAMLPDATQLPDATHAPSGSIDLGELPHGGPPEHLDPWPARARLRRWRTRPVYRVAGVAAIAALVLGTAAAAAAAPPPAFTLELAVETADYNAVADEQHLYVFDPTGSTDETVVVAYRLTDGTVAWRTSVPGQRGYLGLLGEALLAITYVDVLGEGWPADQTARLDRDSGRTMWAKTGWPVGMAGDRLLLSRTLSTYDEGEDPLSSLTAVDPATGEQAWRIQSSRWDYSGWDTATGLVVTLDSQSRLATHDLATGELLASTSTGATTDPRRESYWAALRTFGSLAFLLEEVGGELQYSAYDAVTLQRRWTLPADQRRAPWLARCGELICLIEPDGVPRALDPESGRTVWSASWLPPITGANGYEIIDLARPDLAGYAVVWRSWRETEQPESWVIDPATGEPVLDLGRWNPTGIYQPLPGLPNGMLTLGTEAGTWIGRLRPDLSGVEVLGMIEGATVNEYDFGTHCTPGDARVVCFTDVLSAGRQSQTDVRVWRIR